MLTTMMLGEKQPEDHSRVVMENCGDDDGAGGEAARG